MRVCPLKMASMSTKPSEITVATFNVHEWGDAKMRDNVDRVAAVVRVRLRSAVALDRGKHSLIVRVFSESLQMSSVCKRPTPPANTGSCGHCVNTSILYLSGRAPSSPNTPSNLRH